MLKYIKRIIQLLRELRLKLLLIRVEKVINEAGVPDFTKSENSFHQLQKFCQTIPEYGYDSFHVFKRASQRVVNVINQPGLDQPGLAGLDLGAGDGMLSVLLQTYGHQMTLCDKEDWRVDAAKRLSMIIADCSVGIPLPDATFDFVVSYNSFEHFPDPKRVMLELLRLTKPGGILYFEFGPLYYSPWGLHAYRSLKMPYPQLLFSNKFIENKLDEIGIWDLGKPQNKLQYLNRWGPSQFEYLWNRPELTVINYFKHKNEKHLNLILDYPDCFRGRNLTIDDLICSNIEVTLRRS